MLKNIKWNIFIINFVIDIVLVILPLIFSSQEMPDRLIISLACFSFGIIASLSMALFLYVNFQSSELRFQVFTMFFLIGTLLGIIVMAVNAFYNDFIVFSLMILPVNIFFICLYSRLHIWKIDYDEYMENKRQNKIKIDNEKIIQ